MLSLNSRWDSRLRRGGRGRGRTKVRTRPEGHSCTERAGEETEELSDDENPNRGGEKVAQVKVFQETSGSCSLRNPSAVPKSTTGLYRKNLLFYTIQTCNLPQILPSALYIKSQLKCAPPHTACIPIVVNARKQRGARAAGHDVAAAARFLRNM